MSDEKQAGSELSGGLDAVPIKFTPDEIAALERHPDALRLAANDYHEIQLTMAEPMMEPGDSFMVAHEARKAELLAAADRLQSEYERG